MKKESSNSTRHNDKSYLPLKSQTVISSADFEILFQLTKSVNPVAVWSGFTLFASILT